MALERIFRVGFSLTLQLKSLADTLVKGGLDPVGLEEPCDEVVRALRARRPEYPRALDTPPAGGHALLRHLADVPRAAAALETIAKNMHAPKRE